MMVSGRLQSSPVSGSLQCTGSSHQAMNLLALPSSTRLYARSAGLFQRAIGAHIIRSASCSGRCACLPRRRDDVFFVASGFPVGGNTNTQRALTQIPMAPKRRVAAYTVLGWGDEMLAQGRLFRHSSPRSRPSSCRYAVLYGMGTRGAVPNSGIWHSWGTGGARAQTYSTDTDGRSPRLSAFFDQRTKRDEASVSKQSAMSVRRAPHNAVEPDKST